MKKPVVTFIIAAIILGLYSCNKPNIVAEFKDQRNMTIYDYIAANKDKYSSFLSIIQKGKLDKTLSAYNPKGAGYTLFLPDNNAIDKFIREGQKYSSLDNLLNDSSYVYVFCRYYVVGLGIMSNDFPFGALPELTLSKDNLTVSIVIQKDTAYYLINNVAPVTKANIELSNGYIHLIGKALSPITFTSYDWISQHPEYSIFKEALDVTGLKDTVNLNMKILTTSSQAFTMLVEADTVFSKRGVNSITDLENLISPSNSNYTSSNNPLHNFVAYHILTGSKFLDNFSGVATNYPTLSDIPLNINGMGLNIMINKGKQSFDTIVSHGDTTIIDYIGFNYDASNVITESGAIHFIDQVMTQQSPSRAIQTYEFWEEPLLNKFRLQPSQYLIEDHESLYRVTWSGADLFFVKSADANSSAWSGDWLQITGDFSIAYTIPKIVQGKYNFFLAADAYNSTNALIEVYIDGKKIGGLIDLSTGGSAASPFVRFSLGTIEFLTYEEHTIEVRSLIPGRFCWDYVRFEPY